MSFKRLILWQWVTVLIAIAAIMITIGVILYQTADPQQKRGTNIEKGSPAPEFNATDLIGNPVSLNQYRGKVVLLNFWASWCGPCVREMPLLNDISQTYAKDVQAIFINVGESKGTIREFMDQHQFDFNVVVDATGKLSGTFKVTGLPATMIIDREGNFNRVLWGELSEDMPIEQWLEEL
ncbi:TlpA family protein disulfide reductase [Paenibacillus illinoisensis]|uniref:Alkyl hydroperoxide reductase n=1 Tax=Paenibacillus illinoisensis TaxID=59845 RepID=A0A2W0CAQ3_9BACL|nr:TlpA disulfide reductase family protein [Paenibacillus illinoisensis]PYY29656.1 Alkyl hydroperoxide reductase [Paenibacillus illinoisensis]